MAETRHASSSSTISPTQPETPQEPSEKEPTIVGTNDQALLQATNEIVNPMETPPPDKPFTEGEAAMQGRGLDNRPVRYSAPDPGVADAKAEEKEFLPAALKLAGYRETDVVGFDQTSRTFVTKNGGKYQVNKKGTQIRHLAGPIPPALEKEIQKQVEAQAAQ